MGAPHRGRWSYACSKAIDEFLALAYYRERRLADGRGTAFQHRRTASDRAVRDGRADVRPSGPGRAADHGLWRRAASNAASVTSETWCGRLLDLIGSDEHYGEVFNIGSREEMTILELAERVKQVTGSALGDRDGSLRRGLRGGLRGHVPPCARHHQARGGNWLAPVFRLDDILQDVVASEQRALAQQGEGDGFPAGRVMTQVLVTGGGGFIGSHLAAHLLDQGYQVRVLDNFATGRRENLRPWRSTSS